MRHLGVCVVILAAACGGGAKGPAEPAAKPKSAAVVELDGLADKVCACADAECAGEAYFALLEREEALMNQADAAAIQALHDRAGSCYADKTGMTRGEAVVATFRTHVGTVCACADAACAKAANAEMDAKYEGVEVHYTEADTRAMRDLVDEWRACMSKWPEEVHPAVAAAEQMAGEICACADFECAMQAASRGAKALEAHKDAKGSEADAERIVAAGQRSAECVKALSEKEKASPPAGGGSPR